jgi:hypothetical protein
MQSVEKDGRLESPNGRRVEGIAHDDLVDNHDAKGQNEQRGHISLFGIEGVDSLGDFLQHDCFLESFPFGRIPFSKTAESGRFSG